MRKRIAAWIGVALCLCLFAGAFRANAGSTDMANGFIDTDRLCMLELTYSDSGKAFPGVSVELYRVAEVSSDFYYTATEDFVACGLQLNGITSQSEWNAVTSTVANHVAAGAIEPAAVAQTDPDGKAVFTDLKPGLYMAAPVRLTCDGFRYYFAAVLCALPTLDAENNWQYELTAKCKPDIDNPTGEDICYKVLKLWKDSGNEQNRTEFIEIEIIKDGVTMQTVTLSDENNWSFAWFAEDDGSIWAVREKNIPKGYTVTVENRETTFTVVNSYDDPDNPPGPPTGDTANIGLYAILLCLSGAGLLMLAALQGRGKHG